MRWLLPCYAAYRTSQTEFQTGSTRGRRRGAPSSENVGPSAAGPMQGSTLRAAGEFPTTTNLASESQSGNTSAFLVTYLVRLPTSRLPGWSVCRARITLSYGVLWSTITGKGSSPGVTFRHYENTHQGVRPSPVQCFHTVCTGSDALGDPAGPTGS